MKYIKCGKKEVFIICFIVLVFLIEGCVEIPQEQPKYPKLEGNVYIGGADFGGVITGCVDSKEWDSIYYIHGEGSTGAYCCWVDSSVMLKNVGDGTANNVKVECKLDIFAPSSGSVIKSQTKEIGTLGVGSDIRVDIKFDNLECYRPNRYPHEYVYCEITCSNCGESLTMDYR